MKTEEELYGLAERRYCQHGTDSIFFCTDALQAAGTAFVDIKFA
jgi:hypothetical protein